MLRPLLKLTLIALIGLGFWLGWGLWFPAKPGQGQILLLRPGWSARHIALELKRQNLTEAIKLRFQP